MQAWPLHLLLSRGGTAALLAVVIAASGLPEPAASVAGVDEPLTRSASLGTREAATARVQTGRVTSVWLNLGDT